MIIRYKLLHKGGGLNWLGPLPHFLTAGFFFLDIRIREEQNVIPTAMIQILYILDLRFLYVSAYFWERMAGIGLVGLFSFSLFFACLRCIIDT